MRNKFAEALYRLSRSDPRIHIVVADISPAGPMNEFRKEFPERFINVGVAEQSMIGICAGLALKGMLPFAYTIATFALYRPFEMVRDDLCYQNLPVTVVGIGGGVIYSTLGGTHYAQEDITIAGAIPNMSILAPCDPAEATAATEYLVGADRKGPCYLRFGKAGEPDITKDAIEPFRFGKLRYLRRGRDVAILSYGVTMGLAVKAAAALADKGKSVSVIGCPTVKPLDREGVIEVLRSHPRVVVAEENAPRGGLASEVKSVAWDIQARCALQTITLKDEFVHCYGSHEDLLAAHGLSVPAIVAAAGG
ncbi:MAG: transketolase [Alphaproteobacteria bacterium]|nr:transketolase [Alphaproteobacteria bacterium]